MKNSFKKSSSSLLEIERIRLKYEDDNDIDVIRDKFIAYSNNDNRDITQSSSLLLLPANNSHINNNFGRPNSFNNTNSSSFTQNAFEPLQYIHENNDNNNDNHDEKRRKLEDNKCNDKDNRTLGTW